MTEDPERVLRPGHRISLGEDAYTVIQLNGTAVTLQDEHGELSAVLPAAAREVRPAPSVKTHKKR